MAKGPSFKFPRITAGFYSITKDGEFMGYIMKEVDDGSKETNWWVISDSTEGKDQSMMNTENSIDSPDSLLREAKETAKNYFLNHSPVEQTQVSSSVNSELNETENEPSVELSQDDDFEHLEDVIPSFENNLQDDFEEFSGLVEVPLDENNDFHLDDELDMEDEFDYAVSSELELSLV